MNFYSTLFTTHLGHPEFEAIAAAVVASPANCAPLLILADWLAERGDQLAETLARTTDTRLFEFYLAAARFESITSWSVAELCTHVCHRVIDANGKSVQSFYRRR